MHSVNVSSSGSSASKGGGTLYRPKAAAASAHDKSGRPAVTARLRCLKLKGVRRSSMASLDWSQCPAVESVPGKVSGAWVFKGTRTSVAIVFENLEDGMTIDELLEQFPVTREQVRAVLEFAARSLDAPVSTR
jgi:uncharacterized protein (DUF433 family)